MPPPATLPYKRPFFSMTLSPNEIEVRFDNPGQQPGGYACLGAKAYTVCNRRTWHSSSPTQRGDGGIPLQQTIGHAWTGTKADLQLTQMLEVVLAELRSLVRLLAPENVTFEPTSHVWACWGVPAAMVTSRAAGDQFKGNILYVQPWQWGKLTPRCLISSLHLTCASVYLGRPHFCKSGAVLSAKCRNHETFVALVSQAF